MLTWNADFAVGFCGLMGMEKAVGQAFHITSDEVLTWNQIYRAAGRAAGVEPKIVHIPSDLIVAHDPDAEGTLLGDKSNSAVFDNSKIKSFVPEFSPRRSPGRKESAAPSPGMTRRKGAGRSTRRPTANGIKS